MDKQGKTNTDSINHYCEIDDDIKFCDILIRYKMSVVDS